MSIHLSSRSLPCSAVRTWFVLLASIGHSVKRSGSGKRDRVEGTGRLPLSGARKVHALDLNDLLTIDLFLTWSSCGSYASVWQPTPNLLITARDKLHPTQGHETSYWVGPS